ncbi:bacillithiol biosynthesis deacetylase BshB1 [Mesohalobacter halotolerans]|jgi:bacillithiol biosynthesis deacetylase BshB1|uniref:Bacillithiol biosynthesis deacetylase BshB1 n=1 Tax=Mesohalobacter halotolerans TaxID=1883405 RepID=A0A4U5TRS2_9FLAO|nr:bacillithiol biosynthesis deacetylase BshB1 [Mesohalobacter halotolerans]MBS3738062.1 bacillithiol biosynthesis deacetylase BshB1 [Psychroflexus sp.]NBC57112.1 bacillithiol biosynthesis deacetylase BshB1 [Bacteroidota bacterium]TKS56094.1 bacillithiol biosynthesis deacetylase BshB1 [Mesohalobacter halotolerans]
MKLDILAFGAHPDDVELSCAGTLAVEIQNGKSVGIIDLTRGEMGTRGNAETRAQEAKDAAEILGVSMRDNLGFKDALFVNNEAHKHEVVRVLRQYQPKVVFCNAIQDRHIDHGRASQLVSQACFLSGLKKYETTLNGEVQDQWRPSKVYHYIQWHDIEPDFVVDISNTIDKKIASVKAYKTQFHNPNSNEPETPISSSNFMESISYRARNFGRIIGVDYAEGFTVERYIGVKSVFDLI